MYNSRNALDLVLVRFKKELASTIAQVATEKENALVSRRDRDKCWRMLETINLCRPLLRDHAVATSLAEYETDSLMSSATTTGGVSVETSGGKGTNGPHTPTHGGAEGKALDDELRPPKVRGTSALSIYQQLCSSITLNGPTPDAVARDLKLEHILRHPVTLELFKDCMIKDHTSESLMLLLDIRRYKGTSDPQLRAVLSREIFGTTPSFSPYPTIELMIELIAIDVAQIHLSSEVRVMKLISPIPCDEVLRSNLQVARVSYHLHQKTIYPLLLIYFNLSKMNYFD
jgi:hypothetical protein